MEYRNNHQRPDQYRDRLLPNLHVFFKGNLHIRDRPEACVENVPRKRQWPDNLRV
jgi:hypothetical protein